MREDPGQICFSDLFEPLGDNQIIDEVLKAKWQNYQIKHGQQEGVDYILVTREVITAFLDRYGSCDKDPLLSFMRLGVM